MNAPTPEQTRLSARMHERADAENLPDDHSLRATARAFDRATKGFYASPQTIGAAGFVGAWARARRAWHAHTGESWH